VLVTTNKPIPAVSVVMPAYNAEKYIGEAIESILNQTFDDFELIIIDDASTDSTWKIIQEYAKKDTRVVIFQNEKNLKLAKTLNIGILKAQGKYIARMDADDISLLNRFQKQFDFMEENPEVVILGGSMKIIDQNGSIRSYRKYHQDDSTIRRYIFRYSPFCHPTIFIRRSCLNKTVGYDEKYNPAEDYHLYFQLGRLGKFANLKDTLICYRVVDNSMTTGKLKEMELKTIKIRLEYFKEYHGTFIDMTYTMAQLLTLYFTPKNIRIWLFTKIREYYL
jgi:glycosyltransferase involved in cell wall biosynthesis